MFKRKLWRSAKKSSLKELTNFLKVAEIKKKRPGESLVFFFVKKLQSHCSVQVLLLKTLIKYIFGGPMKSLLTLVTALIFSVSALAVEQKIAVITSDAEKDVGEMLIEVVDGRADSLRIKRLLGQQIVSDDTVPVERLMGDEGLVATERMGYDVVVIKFENFDVMKGGTVLVDYLYNGLLGKRKEFRMKFVKEGSAFVLKSLEGTKVNRIHFLANKILRQMVGIKSVEVSFK